MYSSKNKEYYR